MYSGKLKSPEEFSDPYCCCAEADAHAQRVILSVIE
jgi:hypothetical protein